MPVFLLDVSALPRCGSNGFIFKMLNSNTFLTFIRVASDLRTLWCKLSAVPHVFVRYTGRHLVSGTAHRASASRQTGHSRLQYTVIFALCWRSLGPGMKENSTFTTKVTKFTVKTGFHHRGTEIAEFGVFINQKLFSPRPPRLRVRHSYSLHHGDMEFAERDLVPGSRSRVRTRDPRRGTQILRVLCASAVQLRSRFTEKPQERNCVPPFICK